MENNKEQILEVLKALSNKVRLDIVFYLISGEKCVCKIFEHLNLSQNLVSHHLGILKKQKIIIGRREGKWIHYSLNINNLKYMATYTYKCLDCANIFEIQATIQEKEEGTSDKFICPGCLSKNLSQEFSAVNFIKNIFKNNSQSCCSGNDCKVQSKEKKCCKS